MGRPKNPKNADLPPGMTRRPMKSGAVHYYAAGPNGAKIPLGTDLADARIKWAELRRETPTAPDLFASVAAQYRKSVLPSKSPKTQKEYSASLDRLEVAFEGARLPKIMPMHVRQYLDMRAAKVSANRDIAVFSALFNWAREIGITSASNPAQGVRRHRENPRDVYVSPREFAAVWWHAEHVLRDVLDIGRLTGQREADILKMQWRDISDGRLWVKQNKRGAKVGINIVGRLAWIIKRAKTRRRNAVGPHLIQTEDGQRLTYAMFRKRFDAAREGAGAKWQFRDLRAATATDLDDLRHAQQLLGHRSETTTAGIYRRLKGNLVEPGD